MPWVVIPNSVFEANKPARAIDMRNLRDNIAAAMAGEANAPRLQLPALGSVVAGAVAKVTRDTTVQTLSTLNIEIFKFGFLQTGSVRLSLEQRNTSGGVICTIDVVRVRGGVSTTIQTWTHNGGSFLAQTGDFDVQAGDSWTLGMRTGSGSVNVQARNIRMASDGGTIWPGPTDGLVLL